MLYNEPSPLEVRVLSRRFGLPNSASIDTYLATDGYKALRKALEMKPEEIIEQVKDSALRGRGGAGFPTGMKWSFVPRTSPKPKYIVCNADESEPGSFKDRYLMEYDPHALIEGMIIAGHTLGSNTGYIYTRGEYKYLIDIMDVAIAEAREAGILGKNVLGSSLSFDIHTHTGAGAYICSEETALLTSLEGYRGHPRMKPPFPAVEGLYAKPTIVNNVESICNVTHVMRYGVDWYKQFGTEKSTGMRIFCLSGNVKRPGLYELPHATPLRELIYTYGGGPEDNNAPVKAVCPGGLSMKLLTASQLDTLLDYESVQAAG